MGATPIRGWWSEECQKNWSPFLGQPSLRWLYSPASGGVVDQHGAGMAERRTWDPALCGGTQLVPVPNTAGHFLGIGHGFDPLPGGGRRY